MLEIFFILLLTIFLSKKKEVSYLKFKSYEDKISCLQGFYLKNEFSQMIQSTEGKEALSSIVRESILKGRPVRKSFCDLKQIISKASMHQAVNSQALNLFKFRSLFFISLTYLLILLYKVAILKAFIYEVDYSDLFTFLVSSFFFYYLWTLYKSSSGFLVF